MDIVYGFGYIIDGYWDDGEDFLSIGDLITDYEVFELNNNFIFFGKILASLDFYDETNFTRVLDNKVTHFTLPTLNNIDNQDSKILSKYQQLLKELFQQEPEYYIMIRDENGL